MQTASTPKGLPRQLTTASRRGKVLPMKEETMYPIEELGEDWDDGTMPNNVEELAKTVVGRKIVAVDTGVEDAWYNRRTLITLDDGTRVVLNNTDDCCAFTEVKEFLLHPDKVDHVIMGVGTTEGYDKWHIYCDYGDILELTVGWSCGNPFYYGYGFDIEVVPA